jgi:hypothetical protein
MKKFAYCFCGLDCSINVAGNETAKHLLTVRFPEPDIEHAEVKEFCEDAEVGWIHETKRGGIIVCTEDDGRPA